MLLRSTVKTNLNSVLVRKLILIGCFGIFPLYLFVEGITRPANDYDMLCYVACAVRPDFSSNSELHTWLFTSAKERLPHADYQALLGGWDHRDVWCKDPDAFCQLLPFFKMRLLYIFLVRTAYLLGMDPFFASYFISACAAAAAAILFLLLVSRKSPIWFLPVAILVMMAFGIGDIGRMQSPDALGLLAVMLIAFFYVGNKIKSLLAVCLLVLFVRNDLVVYTLFVLVFLLYTHKMFRLAIVAVMIASVAIVVIVPHITGNYGWERLVSFSLIDMRAYPATDWAPVTFAKYLWCVKMGIKNALIYDKTTLAFLGMAVICSQIIILKFQSLRKNVAILPDIFFFYGISIGFVVVHFVLFPALWSRFFIGHFMNVALIAVIVANTGKRDKMT